MNKHAATFFKETGGTPTASEILLVEAALKHGAHEGARSAVDEMMKRFVKVRQYDDPMRGCAVMSVNDVRMALKGES